MTKRISGPKWDTASIIRQAKARSARRTELAGAAAALAGFPKTLNLLLEVSRLPGLALV